MLGGFQKPRLRRIEERLDRLASSLEKARFHDYLQYVSNRKRMLWTSFLTGLARGIGMAIGFTILGALLIYILRQIAGSSLPILGDFIAKLLAIVESKR